MKIGAWIIAVVGILVVLVAFFIRFYYEGTVSLMGGRSGSILLVGNTLILVSILFAVLNLHDKGR